MIHLETDRLILRDYTDKDFDAYFKLKSDARTMYYLQDIQTHSPEEARSEFCEVLSDQGLSFLWHIQNSSNALSPPATAFSCS